MTRAAYIVFGRRLLQDLLERDEILEVDATTLSPVGDLEEQRILLAADLAKVSFRCNRRNKVWWGQVAG